MLFTKNKNIYFHLQAIWVRRIHNLLTELLINFPQNVRELRLWDESIVRRMGVDPGGFATLLNALVGLYDVPGSPLHARLALEYWWPAGETRITPSANVAAAGLAGSASSECGSAAAATALNASFRAGEVENSRQVVMAFLINIHFLFVHDLDYSDIASLESFLKVGQILQ